MIVLDTNVISEIFRPAPEPRVVDWLASLTGDVAITSVTLAELLAGVRRLADGRRRDELNTRIDAALEPYRGGRAVLPFDDLAADRYADVLVSRENAGVPISTGVAQIAAICLSLGATCATRNVKDFVHTGVDLVVMSREVGQSGDWGLASYSGMCSVMIVEVHPLGQGCVALCG